MIEKSPKLLWGLIAFAIYFTLVGLLIFYFNTRDIDKSKHYVKKDERRIQVALSAPKREKISKLKVKKKQTPNVTTKSKNPPKTKDTKKKVVKEKLVKKLKRKKEENRTKAKVKKINKPKLKKKKSKKTKDLFSNVKVKKKKLDIKITDTPVKKKIKNTIIKVTEAPPSAIERINKSLKKKENKDTGVENAYFAKVKSMLDNWPARSDFIDESATVTLYIKPTGKFEFQVTSGSNNEAFATSIMDFLEQLQGIGFGRHNAGRNYEFEVEFTTKQ